MPSERIQGQIDRLSSEMNHASDNQDWSGMSSAGLRILAVDPTNAAALDRLISLVELHANTHDWRSMVELCDQMLEINPDVEDAKSFLLIAPDEDVATSAKSSNSDQTAHVYQPASPPRKPTEKHAHGIAPVVVGIAMIIVGSIGWGWMQSQVDEYQEGRDYAFGIGGLILDITDAFDDSVDFDQVITNTKIARNISGGIVVAGSIVTGFGVLRKLEAI